MVVGHGCSLTCRRILTPLKIEMLPHAAYCCLPGSPEWRNIAEMEKELRKLPPELSNSVQLVGHMKRKMCIIQTAALLALSVARVEHFPLWALRELDDQTLGYQQPGDIGGPMDINEEYRWNVPVVTYAFDQSFLDYFGSNGVAAVEQAIGVINELPPASSIDLDQLPFGFAAR